MQRGISPRLPYQILVAAFLMFAFLNPAQAQWTVHDPQNFAEAVKQLNQMKKEYTQMLKEYEEVVKIASYSKGTMDKLGALAKGNYSSSQLMNAVSEAAQCAIPELSMPNLPNDFSANFFSACEAGQAARKLLNGDPEGEEIDGVPVTGSKWQSWISTRREAILEDSIIEAYGQSMYALNTAKETASEAETIIQQTNAEEEIDGILRSSVSAQTSILSELNQIKLLLAYQIRMEAADRSRRIKTYVTLAGSEEDQ
ncbi:hypothetical protein [Aestuariispira insulae]|uniref:Type IV secretion system protein VirB5 n=1 Tax=Aestuariispira insulae TaxID=1461337 RepID=A0A3D9H3N8_9PROT|nr:hypothetical protein [Aestuariispira insulae]RED44118.1 hypothetical protein DFP90_11721 [Aestuariispira insulae]